MNFFVILLAAFLFSCSAPPKKQYYPEVSMKTVANSKPEVVYSTSKKKKITYKTTFKTSKHSKKIDHLIKIYGADAETRIKNWKYTIVDYQRKSDFQKLHIANRFINRLAFIDDNVHWNKQDYWATPMETLASRGGDCEDLAIAKYYTLSKLGISNQCLTLSYVKVKHYSKPHMVLIYQCDSKDEPIVLDNLKQELLSVKQRKDLTPVYSFNHKGVWLASSLGKQQKLSSTSRLKLWDNLRMRIRQENF